MDVRPVTVTVIETATFLRQSDAIWDAEERSNLVDYIARNPLSGDVIPATGGVRKLRWSRAGSGKRGGARVVYFYYHAGAPIYLLLAYAKASREDMTVEEKRQVAELTLKLKKYHALKVD